MSKLFGRLKSLVGTRDSKSEQKDSKEDKKDSKEKKGEDSGAAGDDSGPQLPLYLSDFVSRMVGQEAMCDAAFVVGRGKGQKRLEAHKLVLAISSPVFEAMLYPPQFEDTKEKQPDVPNCVEVFLPDVDPDMFEGLLKCIYTDKLNVEGFNITALVDMANKYQIEKMQTICADYLEHDVNLENACELFNQAPQLLGDPDFGLDFIAENAEEIFQTDSFLNLSRERMNVIVRSDKLSCPEGLVFSACVRWAHNECKKQGLDRSVPENVREAMGDLISHIRFAAMTLHDLSRHVAPSGLLGRDTLLNLYKYVAVEDPKERSRIATPFLDKPREGGSLTRDTKILDRKFKKDLVAMFGKGYEKPELKLLYRGSKDGFTATAFHAACDGKGPTLTVVKVKQYVFGGFNGASWTQSGSYTTDPSWLFSLVNDSKTVAKFVPNSSSNNSYSASGYGPTWGAGHDLHLNSDMKSMNNYSNPNSYALAPGYKTVSYTQSFFAGSNKFSVDEVEVFAVSKPASS